VANYTAVSASLRVWLHCVNDYWLIGIGKDFKWRGHDITEILSRQFLGVTLKNPENPEDLGVAAVVRNGHPTGYKCYCFQPFRRMLYYFFFWVCKLLLCLFYQQCYHHHIFKPALVCGDNNQLSPVLFPVSTLHSSSSCLPCFVTWQVISWIRFVGSRKSTKPCSMQAGPPCPLRSLTVSLRTIEEL